MRWYARTSRNALAALAALTGLALPAWSAPVPKAKPPGPQAAAEAEADRRWSVEYRWREGRGAAWRADGLCRVGVCDGRVGACDGRLGRYVRPVEFGKGRTWGEAFEDARWRGYFPTPKEAAR